MSKYTGRGGKISLGDPGTLPVTYTEVAQVASIGSVGIASDETEVSTLDNSDGFKEFLQTFKDSGELPLTLIWDADQPTHGENAGGLWGMFTTGITVPIELEFPTFPRRTLADFAGFVKAFPTPALTPADALTADVSIRVSGVVLMKKGGYAPMPGGKLLSIDDPLSASQTAFINTPFTYPLAVKVIDQATGADAVGVTVNFSVPGATPTAVLSGPSAVTDAFGIASVTATADGTVGEYDVIASAISGLESVTFHLINRI